MPDLVAFLILQVVVKFANFCKDVAEAILRKTPHLFQLFYDALRGKGPVYNIL